MRSPRICANWLAPIVLSFVGASHLNDGAAKEQLKAQVFALPKGDFSPFRINQCAEDGPVLFWSGDPANKNPPVFYGSVLYTFDFRSGNLKELLRGTYGNIVCSPLPHLFSVDLRTRNRSTLVVMDDAGKEGGRLEPPTPASFISAQWTSDGTEIVFEQQRPGITDEDPDFDPNGFTALGVLNLADWKTRWFGIHPTGYGFRITNYQGGTYACISRDNPEGDPAKRKKNSAYELTNGSQVESDSGLLAFCSDSGHTYYSSRQYEMPSPFQILESKTKRSVASFPAADSVTHDALTAGPWNPKNDDVLVVEHRSGSTNHLLSVDIYRVSQARVLASFKTSAYTWSYDGRFLIVFRGGSFVFEPSRV